MDSTGIKILLVDNYDSFTWNIAHCIRNHPGVNLQIIEANEVDLKKVASYDKILFSPGPDLPRQGNMMEKILAEYSTRKPIFGICLGLQAIWTFFGGKLLQMEEPVHGRKRVIKKTGNPSLLLSNIPDNFEAGLYHSWIADNSYVPHQITVTAITEEGLIMGIRHRLYDIEAVQFHPESIMTPLGKIMINSWLTGQDINK
jgi:anthranilate synthase component II